MHDLGSWPGKARELGWKVSGFLSWKQLKATPTAEQGLVQSAILLPIAHLGAASCPTDVIVSGLGTRLEDAFAMPTVASRLHSATVPPLQACTGFVATCTSAVRGQALCTKQWS